MTIPEVSIVIPCFNDSEFILNTLRSARAMNINHAEIIIVDDGSDKKTKLLIESLHDYWDTLISQENKGQSAARNVGIAKAKSDIILTLDSDDYFEPQFVREALDRLAIKDCKLVTSYANLVKDEKIVNVHKPKGGSLTDFLFQNGAHGSAMFRKKEWKEAGGYDENMRDGWEDWEFYIRLLKSGGYCSVIPDVLFNYRIRQDSTTSRANRNRKKLWSYILKKHKDIYVQHYDELVDFFLNRMDSEAKGREKVYETLDYKIGRAALFVPRKIKALWKD
ncbi:glycosyltransferase family 2 protein [Croceiramulus getboli]|nr:glycosyltransferase [Flavobacteriaceae bacterium YJPT1-3]